MADWAAVALALVLAGTPALAEELDDVKQVVKDRSLCRLEKVEGDRLLLRTEGDLGKPGRGWALASEVKSINQAIADDSKKILERPDSGLYFDRGRFWLAKGESDIAIADFDEVIRVDPRCAPAFFHRGRAWVDKGVRSVDSADVRRGLADLDQAIRLAPNSVAAYCERGSAWMKLGQIYSGQLTDAERSLERFEEWFRLSKEYDLAKQKADAAENADTRSDSDFQKLRNEEMIEERKSRLASYRSNQREYLRVIKFARMDSGAAYRNATLDFDAAIRIDPTDPRGLENRERLRTLLSADAGKTAWRD